ncbi:hypothetical protein A3842_11065 [Paenibacillus sp. P3E]|uniref:DUF7167 family protein n=1 Tax=Paenibacillus sp. P3E TaxID=1349435 RepID=UPI000938EEDE|nr:hypothetical protein [Paenibacillus sp. P3E]OKP81613.1 hypothetical protein A3842_11065 [Paenibacillus sp. P3E]
MAKFKFVVYSPYVNANVEDEVEYPDEVFENMTEDEKYEYLNKEVKEWMLQTTEWGWEEI